MKNYTFKPKAFNRRIEVRKSLGQPIIESMQWTNLKLDFIFKWEWYFNYRAALLQIKYPKADVRIIKWQSDPIGRTKEQINVDLKKKRIVTCKRMITKLSNKINTYEKEQSSTLIPFLDNKNYLKAKTKKEEYKKELSSLTH